MKGHCKAFWLPGAGTGVQPSTLGVHVRGTTKKTAYLSSLLGCLKVLWNCPDFRFRLGLYLAFLYKLVIHHLDDAFKTLERLGHYGTSCLQCSVLVLQERIDTAIASQDLRMQKLVCLQ